MKKAAGIFCAMNFVGGGVSLFLQSGLGSDPIGILCDGMSRMLEIQFGHASLIYNLTIILLAFLIAKQNLGLGTVVYAVCSGYFIDFYCWVLMRFHLADCNMGIRMLSCLFGEILFALGLAVLIRFKLGMNALDALLYQVEKKTRITYLKLRMSTDIIYTILGGAMGGVFGIGTILSLFLTGMLVSILTRKIPEFSKKQIA